MSEPTITEWRDFAREVARGTQPEDYGKWSAYYQRVLSRAVELLDRSIPQNYSSAASQPSGEHE
jgi:hypothetical protein